MRLGDATTATTVPQPGMVAIGTTTVALPGGGLATATVYDWPGEQLIPKTVQQLREEFVAKAAPLYPQAAAAWQASRGNRTDLVAQLPWLPYVDPVKLLGTNEGPLSYPYADPYPGFNFGGGASFAGGGEEFAGPDWRNVIARAGARPDATYLSAFVQSPLPGAGKYDYVQALYVRAGDFFKPIAAYGKGRASGWLEFRDEALKPALAIAAALGGAAWLSQQIGAGLVGSTFAAANPGITSAIGQTVLQTAVNGGDLGAAIKGVAIGAAGGLVGAQAGSLASSLTDSKLLADVATAAVSTAVQGGDVETAVARTLAQTGASSIASLFQPSTQETAAVDYFDPVYDAPADLDLTPAQADYFDPVYTPDAAAPGSWTGTDWTTTPDFSSWTDWNFNSGGLDVPAPSSPSPASSSSGGSGFDAAIVTLTNAALAAIKINQAYQASQQPQLRTQTVSGSTVSTPNPNGTLTVRNTMTGQVATTRPSAGVPYTLTDGRTIINNGNGTYSLIARDGSTQTLSYGASSSSPYTPNGIADTLAKVPPAVWAIGAGLVIAAMRSRR